MPLKTEQHEELNNPRTPYSRFYELRAEYVGDRVALQQIDMYDPASPYMHHWRRYRDAMLNRDTANEAAELAWLREHYPDVTPG